MQLVDDKGKGYTSLHLAAEDGVKEVARSLAEAADGSVDGKNDAQTALHLAARGRTVMAGPVSIMRLAIATKPRWGRWNAAGRTMMPPTSRARRCAASYEKRGAG